MGRSARSRQLYASGPRAGPGHRTAGDGTQTVSVLLRSKKAPSGAPTGFQLPHPCFLPDALYTAQPPARSNDERGAYFWIGFSNTSYLLLSLDYRSDARGNIWGIENSGYLPIHKTSGTRRRLLWFLPKYSRVAHPSEKCFVFGNLPELRLL